MEIIETKIKDGKDATHQLIKLKEAPVNLIEERPDLQHHQGETSGQIWC